MRDNLKNMLFEMNQYGFGGQERYAKPMWDVSVDANAIPSGKMSTRIDMRYADLKNLLKKNLENISGT